MLVLYWALSIELELRTMNGILLKEQDFASPPSCCSHMCPLSKSCSWSLEEAMEGCRMWHIGCLWQREHLSNWKPFTLHELKGWCHTSILWKSNICVKMWHTTVFILFWSLNVCFTDTTLYLYIALRLTWFILYYSLDASPKYFSLGRLLTEVFCLLKLFLWSASILKGSLPFFCSRWLRSKYKVNIMP